MNTNTKWGRKFFEDTAERVAVTAIYGVITMLTADASGAISGSGQQWWVVVGLPSALSLSKCLLANLGSSGPEPTASVVDVSSLGKAN